MNHRYIAVEGNIGSGKTSLAKLIARDFNGKLVLEEFADNPFLPLFYQTPDRYAFQLELSFLAERYQQLKDQLTHLDLFHQLTVSDYIFDKCRIFAISNLGDQEFQLYSKLFDIILPSLPKPDILVYLYRDISNLQKQIKIRGRSYEQEITDEYLQTIQTNYFNFFKQQKDLNILIVDANEIDFVKHEGDYTRLIDVIQQKYEPGIHRVSLSGV